MDALDETNSHKHAAVQELSKFEASCSFFFLKVWITTAIQHMMLQARWIFDRKQMGLQAILAYAKLL